MYSAFFKGQGFYTKKQTEDYKYYEILLIAAVQATAEKLDGIP